VDKHAETAVGFICSSSIWTRSVENKRDGSDFGLASGCPTGARTEAPQIERQQVEHRGLRVDQEREENIYLAVEDFRAACQDRPDARIGVDGEALRRERN